MTLVGISAPYPTTHTHTHTHTHTAKSLQPFLSAWMESLGPGDSEVFLWFKKLTGQDANIYSLDLRSTTD